MRRCRTCGVPLSYSRHISWTPDGTIVARKFPNLRLFFIEIDELLNLLHSIVELLGLPIENLIIESERPIGRRILEMYVPRSYLALTRKVPDILTRGPAARWTFEWIYGFARAMGYGSAKLLTFEGRKGCTVRLRNPCSIPLIAGDGLALFQVFLEANMKVTWERENGTTLMEFRPSEEKPYDVPLPFRVPIPGDIEYERCRKCGVPLLVSKLFDWDLNNGIITNRITAHRESFLSVEGINAIIMELERELGEEILYKIAQKQLEMLGSRLDDYTHGRDRGIWELFEEMKVRGMGNPVEVDEIGRYLRVRVENPFNDALVAGRIAGYFEAVEGVKSRFNWVSSEEGYVVVGVEPLEGSSQP